MKIPSIKNSVASDPLKSEQILSWNLDKIKSKMSQKGYNLDELDQLEIEYKRYLILVTNYSMRLPISAPVDEMWHTHILFTKNYASLCNAIGNFIHHEPILTKEGRELLLPAYAETLYLYEKNWGKPNSKFWPPKGCVCDPEGEGSDDNGGQW